jgi:hypothetical protein
MNTLIMPWPVASADVFSTPLQPGPLAQLSPSTIEHLLQSMLSQEPDSDEPSSPAVVASYGADMGGMDVMDVGDSSDGCAVLSIKDVQGEPGRSGSLCNQPACIVPVLYLHAAIAPQTCCR